MLGVMSYIKKVLRGKEASPFLAWMVDAAPIFINSYGSNVYLSDFVNNAIDRVASEVSKIDLKSITESAGTVKVQNDDISRLFRYKPNPLQTTSDFFANVEWLRRKHCNAFIYPQYELITTPDERQFKRYLAFYPLKPETVYIGVKNGSAWEVKMHFEDGSSFVIPYADLIHVKWRRGTNTIIGGGDDYGRANDTDLLRTITALDKTIQGLPKSIEASLQIKGVYSTKTLADGHKLKNIRDDFESHLYTSASGVVATDLAGEFTPVNIKAPEIPKEAMQFLKAVIQERYGISAAILSGDFTGDQHSAFYQTAIEDFIIQFEQAFTACVYTQREQDLGHRAKCYYSKIRYMATKDKMELADLATKTGMLTLNGVNAMFGIEPFEGGDVRLRSLNYVDASIANEYQMQGKVKPKEGNDG